MKKTFKVYGRPCHRQRESFCDSHNFIDWRGVHYNVHNFDHTGTHDYTLLEMEHSSERIIMESLEAQIYDGIFENSRVGMVVEVLSPTSERVIGI